jgi:hypothetical protein
VVFHLNGGSLKRVLRGTFGHRGKEVTGGWRKAHNEELLDLHCSLLLGKWRVKSRFRNPGSSLDAAEIPRI